MRGWGYVMFVFLLAACAAPRAGAVPATVTPGTSATAGASPTARAGAGASPMARAGASPAPTGAAPTATRTATRYATPTPLPTSTLVAPLLTDANPTPQDIVLLLVANHHSDSYLNLNALKDFSPDIYEKVDLDGDGQEEILFGDEGDGIYFHDFFAILSYTATGWKDVFYEWAGSDVVELQYTIRNDQLEIDFFTYDHGAGVSLLLWHQVWVRCEQGRCWETWSAWMFKDFWGAGGANTRSFSIATLEKLSQDTIRLTTREFSTIIPHLDRSVTPPTLLGTAERIVGPDVVETYQWNGERFALIAREQLAPKTTITGETDAFDNTGNLVYELLKTSSTRPDGSVSSEVLDTFWGRTSDESRTLITSSNGLPDKLGSFVAGVSHIPKYPTCYLIVHRHEAGKFALVGRAEFSCSANFTHLAWADVTGDGIDELLLLTIPQDVGRFWHRLHIYAISDSLEEMAAVEGEINGADGVGVYWEEEPFTLYLGLPFYNQSCGRISLSLSCLDLTRRFQAYRWDAAAGAFEEVEGRGD